MPRKPKQKDGVKLCLTPGCQRPGDHSRDNCHSCYEQYRTAVNNGETTWAKLVRLGVTAESQRPRSNARKVLKGMKSK